MKNTFWLLIIQSILLLSACTGGQTEYWLEQAENYLDKKPDSTLIFLEKIKNPDQLADYPKAKYDLFQTIAGLRKGQAIRTDSLLTKAIDIFIANNDSAKTSNACFWSGFINMQTANYMRADSFFTLGIPFATNPVVRTRLYEYSGFALLYKGNAKQALQQHRLSLQDSAFIPAAYQAEVLAEIGQAYRYSEQTDSAIIYYQKAIRKSLEIESREQTAFFYQKISEIEKEKGNFRNATEALKASQSLCNTRTSYPYHMLTQAQIYIASGETDSARVYLQKAIQSTNTYVATRAYQLLARLYEKNKTDEQIYYAWKNYEGSFSNISGDAESQIMTQRYQEELLKNENNQLKLKKKQQDIYLLSLCLILITACTLWYIVYNRLRKKKIIGEQQLKEQELKNQVAQLEKERELISLRERATALREQLFRRLSASQKIPSLSEKAKENTDDNKSRLTSEEIDELIETVNNIWSGFAERLKNTYPLLRTKDIAFCCLLKSGISTKDLASIYYITPSAISQKKARMKREKFGVEDDNLSLDDLLNAF